jgi:hypothetical protein
MEMEFRALINLTRVTERANTGGTHRQRIVGR